MSRRRYPDGKLAADDHGELAMRIDIYRGVVRIDFGKPIAWLGLDKPSALSIAETIVRYAATLPGPPEITFTPAPPPAVPESKGDA